jgi:uncharacterized protein (TIGR02266 family)
MRTQPRYRVHLKVRYESAREFVQEYAENLSKGGLFIRGARALAPREQVMVEVTLPGYAPFRLVGEVAHVLDPEAADHMGRAPGVGIAVTEAPTNYERALRSYLRLLGKRRECLVFAEDGSVFEALQAAGYQSRPMPPLEDLPDALRGATVLGLVVTPGREREYAVTAFAAGISQRIFQLENLEGLDALLPLLDAGIPNEA